MPRALDEQLYFVMDKDGYTLAGSGCYAVPKLYQRGQAVRVANLNNHKFTNIIGTFRPVPVRIELMEPID